MAHYIMGGLTRWRDFPPCVSRMGEWSQRKLGPGFTPFLGHAKAVGSPGYLGYDVP